MVYYKILLELGNFLIRDYEEGKKNVKNIANEFGKGIMYFIEANIYEGELINNKMDGNKIIFKKY